MPDELTITPKWIGRNGKATVLVKVNDQVLDVDELNLSKATDRERLVDRVTARFSGVDRDVFGEELQRIAAQRVETDDTQAPPAIDLLVGIARDESELFHDPDQLAFATVRVDGHQETYAIRSRAFRLWLRGRLRKCFGLSANRETIAQAIEEIESMAIFDAKTAMPHVRIAEHEGEIYIDLADDEWQAIRVTPDGWSIVSNPPVRFIRPRGLLPLPTPVRGGSIDDLRDFLNVIDKDAFVLVIAWLLAALRPVGPYPVANFTGEQGTAKSTGQRMLRRLVDPNKAPLRAEPREPRDLVIAAKNAHVIGLDNISRIPAWMSDGLCRLATGGGFATRELYTDAEEIIFTAQRPALINGIVNAVTRSDLADRALAIELAVIPDDQRRAETDLWADFDAAAPGILGALLDGVAAGMKNIESVKLDRLPRMADFATWVVACETGVGWAPGTFIRAYDHNRESMNEAAVEGDAVGAAVVMLMAGRTKWSGTATDLLDELSDVADEKITRSNWWPSDATRLSGRLTRVQPNLRRVGIEITRGEGSLRREFHIRRADVNDAEPVADNDHSVTEKTALYAKIADRDAGDTGDAESAPLLIKDDEMRI